MSDHLADVLDRLGLTQYLGRLHEEGFNRWETVLDIQESDLAMMGFKLGHRRILQRAIARERGIPENEPIPWLYQQGYSEETGDDLDEKSSPRGFKGDYKSPVQAKRKYRRHPRPDENAPEKPPSAYVMFANHVREELKGQNLSFTDIARLVGEKWKLLESDQKEDYEFQATTLKERYNQELAEYKKTESYKEYSQYLLEFKAKANKDSGEPASTPIPEIPRKRPKLDSIPSQGSTSTHGSLPGSSTPSVGSVGGQTNAAGYNRSQPPSHAGESPTYQPASIASGHYSSFHGRKDSYTSPFTQPSTPASHMVSPLTFGEATSAGNQSMKGYLPPNPNSYEAVTLSFRDSPGRGAHHHHHHHQAYEQGRPPPPPPPHLGAANPESIEGVMLPKIQSHIQPILSFSRGQPSPGDSPSHHSRRSGSISGTSYQQHQQRPVLHPSDTLSTQNSISSSGSSSVMSLTPATPLDGDGRQMHGPNNLRSLPPLRNASPSQGSSGYFPSRPREMASGSGNNNFPGPTSASSSPRSQLPSLAEQNSLEQQPRRGGD